MSKLRLFVCIAAVAGLLGCAKEEGSDYQARSVEALYNTGVNAMSDERYKEAAEAFDEVERQHPYSVWATKAQLMSAYASYQRDDYGEAIVGLDRFIELHPGNKDVSYAYYLKALCYYEQISDIGRDQKITRLALDALQEVSRRYPDTRYGRDARVKLDLAHDHLAGKDMEIGRYYQQRGEHLAAINRFKTVLKDYDTTTHVPEALHRLTESYLVLGITDEAQMTAAVLGHNFPGSPWYQDSYRLLEGKKLSPAKKSDSWFSWAWNWIN